MATYVIRNGISVNKETGEPLALDPDWKPEPCQIARPWAPFISPSSGKEIRTSGQRKEDQKATGCQDADVKLDGRMKNPRFAKKWNLQDRLG